MIGLGVMLVFLIRLANSLCSAGCLRCSRSNWCLLCDSGRGWVESEGTCFPGVSLLNCEVASSEGGCLRCAPDFAVDKTSGRCVGVKAKLQGCVYYSTDLTCEACGESAYWDSVAMKCVTSPTPVANCRWQDSASTCGTCKSGFIRTASGGCATAEPCAIFSPVNCVECRSGFLLDRLAPLRSFLEAGPWGGGAVTAGLREALVADGVGSWRWRPIKTCIEKGDTEETGTGSKGGESSGCESGFFLDPVLGVCLSNPLPAIPYCVDYATGERCARCAEGFFLRGETCEPIQPINDCQEYAPTGEKTLCIRCLASRSYLSNNVCVTVNPGIAYCTAYAPDSPRCVSCAVFYTLFQGGTACAAEVTNCQRLIVTASAAGPAVASCESCNNGYRLNPSAEGATDSCKPGGLLNCRRIAPHVSVSVCTECESGYYLSNGGCVAHTVLDNCREYSLTIANQCLSCAGAYKLFSVTGSCQPIQAIPNCSTYISTTECGACDTGYALRSSACIASTATRCTLKLGVEGCAVCDTGYYLRDGQCLDAPLAIRNGCSLVVSVGGNGWNWAWCGYCDTGNLPVYSEQAICIEETMLDQPLISGCLIMRKGGGCAMCSSTTYLAENGKCVTVDSCLFGVTNLNFTTDSSQNIIVYGGASCASYNDTLTYCQHQIHSTDGLLCTICITGYYPIVDADPLAAPLNSEAPTRKTFNPTSKTPRIKACSTITTPIANCGLYTLDAAKNPFCSKCAMGYSGTQSNAASAGVSKFAACGKINDCDETVFIEGLSLQANRIFSCHACKSSKVVVAPMYENSGKWVARDAILCKDPTTLPQTISNCAMYYEVKIDTPLSYITKCAACLPGYKPSADFTSCDPIANCAASPGAWYNACEICKSGFAAIYKPGDPAPTFVDCKAVSGRPNCRLHRGDATGQSIGCLVCDKGYALHPDGQCRVLPVPDCSDPVTPAPIPALPVDLFQFLNHWALQTPTALVGGCGTCGTGRRPVFTPSLLCVTSISDSLVKPNNCDRLTFNLTSSSTVLCGRCNSNFIPNADYSACVSTSGVAALANCVRTASITTTCGVCTTGFVLTASGCVANTVSNCKTLAAVPPMLVPTCTSCNDGFALVAGKCVTGQVTNCAVYTIGNVNVCMSCKANYQLVLRVSGVTVCVTQPSPPSVFPCSAFRHVSFSQGEALCHRCASGYYVTTIPPTRNQICLPIPSKANCVRYSTLPYEQPTSADCVECSKGYYLSDGSCIQSTSVTGCTDYSSTTNACITCGPSRFLSSSGACVSYTVLNCQTFSTNSDACTSCLPGFYPSGSSCLVQSQPNCASYQTLTNICSLCNDLYYLTQNRCIAVTKVDYCIEYLKEENGCAVCVAERYATFVGCLKRSVVTKCTSYNPQADACLRCEPFYFLAGPKECLPFPTGIFACASYIRFGVCAQCSAGFFLKGAECVQVPAPVTGCLLYGQAETQCVQCKPGYFLAGAVCFEGNITGCAEYLTAVVCAKCDDDLRWSSEKATCVGPVVPYCGTYSGDTCISCLAGYELIAGACLLSSKTNCPELLVPEGNSCVKPKDPFKGCAVFINQDKCARCIVGLALDPDSFSCVPIASEFIDPNCLDARAGSNGIPFCAICGPGQYNSVEGGCLACPQKTGCAYCDPRDPSVCILCTSGFFMTSELECLSNDTSSSQSNSAADDSAFSFYLQYQ